MELNWYVLFFPPYGITTLILSKNAAHCSQKGSFHFSIYFPCKNEKYYLEECKYSKMQQLR
jgi:hypothetical protein